MSSCAEPGLISVAQAIDKLVSSVSCAPNSESVPLNLALGRVLADSVYSPVDVPPWDNSAMDGYALKYADLENQPLAISQRIAAGVAPSPLQPGTAARIFTGAPVPEGADTVVMQEDAVLLAEGAVKFAESINAGANIRKAGEDITTGQVVVNQGKLLRGQDLGLIASVGVPAVAVYQPLKVALLFSGDELLQPGDAPEPGKIYNSNRYMLAAMMQQQGYDICYQANVPDTLDATINALNEAAQQADVVVTTGGVSVGEEDHLKPAVEHVGSLDLWKIDIKPGKPFAFGQLQTARPDLPQLPFLGLPGNPVSVFSTYLLLALPYLRTLQGENWQPPVPLRLPANFSTKKAVRRSEYLRVKVTNNNGQSCLQKYPHQGSGVLSSAAWCDGFALVPVGTQVQDGDLLDFFSLSQLQGD